jgi:hypothetical protein
MTQKELKVGARFFAGPGVYYCSECKEKTMDHANDVTIHDYPPIEDKEWWKREGRINAEDQLRTHLSDARTLLLQVAWALSGLEKQINELVDRQTPSIGAIGR